MSDLAGALLIIFLFIFCAYGDDIAEKYLSDDISTEKVIGNSIENMQNLKRDCEKDLPRSKECVLVYEYVSVDKGDKQ